MTQPGFASHLISVAVSVSPLPGGISRKAEIAEVLFRVPRRGVRFVHLLQQSEIRPKLSTDRRRIVSRHLQPAALKRPIDRKRGDDDVAIRNQRSLQSLDIFLAVLFLRQKMENSAVVPEAEAMRGMERGFSINESEFAGRI